MALRHLVLALLAASMALPLTYADHTPGCASVTDGGATAVAIPTSPPTTLYVGSDGGVYQEGNNVAGLQSSACTDDNGREIRADGKLL